LRVSVSWISVRRRSAVERAAVAETPLEPIRAAGSGNVAAVGETDKKRRRTERGRDAEVKVEALSLRPIIRLLRGLFLRSGNAGLHFPIRRINYVPGTVRQFRALLVPFLRAGSDKERQEKNRPEADCGDPTFRSFSVCGAFTVFHCKSPFFTKRGGNMQLACTALCKIIP
jgi:hypothetical protein